MTNAEYEEMLKTFVRNTEERYIWYKNQLESVFKDKTSFPSGDELAEWYKEHLREWKNISESSLKKLREELTNFRQGLNPPYLYNYKRKNS